MAAKAFAVVDRFEAVYTGGLVAPATAGGTLACMCGEDISLVDVATGRARSRVPCEGDVLTAFALSADGALLVTAGRSQALRAWAVDGTVPEAGRGWKAPHRAPVVHMALDSTGVLLATGSADKAVYVHDVERGYVTHALRAHGGAISALAFHPDAARLQLVSAAADGLVLVWALAGGDGAGEVVARLDSHVSAPSCLAFSADGRTLVSGGRDKVAVVWDLATKRALRTIPTREPLEGVACVVAAPAAGAPPSLLALTAGEGGQLRAWDTATGKCVAGGSGGGALGAHPAILGLALLPAAKPAGGAKAGGAAAAARDAAAASVCSWDVEQNITFTPLAQLLARLPGQPDDGAKPARRPAEPARDAWARAASVRVLPGSLDEISDLRYLGASAAPMPAAAVAIAAAAAPVVAAGMEAVAGAVVGGGAPSACPLVVVASNSSQLRLLDLGTRACALLSGHSDLVLALDVSADGRWIGSASKDATVRLWCAATGAPAAVGTGHTEPVAALAFCPRTGDLFSGSKDKTIKRWDAGKLMRAWAAAASKGEPEPMALRARASCVAHAKEVNGLALAPTGAQLVSASQDKSLRVWSVSAEGEIALQGPLSGHRRAVWSVAVSQFERVAASASGDCTVRVWSLSDLTCLRTLEGHAGPVLRVAWLNAGTQIASSSSDGLVKIWTAKTGECALTLEAHDERAWSLDVIHKPEHAPQPDKDAGAPTGPAPAVQLLSAGSDGRIVWWRDASAEVAAAATAATRESVVQEQELSNLLHDQRYEDALALALALGRPRAALRAVEAVLAGDDGCARLASALESADPEAAARWLGCIVEWNTSALRSTAAQRVLSALLRRPDAAALFAKRKRAEAAEDDDEPGGAGSGANLPPPLDGRKALEALLPYTEKHYDRLDRLLQGVSVLKLTMHAMAALAPQPGLPDALVPQPAGFKAKNGAGGDSESDDEEERAAAAAAAAAADRRLRRPMLVQSGDDDGDVDGSRFGAVDGSRGMPKPTAGLKILGEDEDENEGEGEGEGEGEDEEGEEEAGGDVQADEDEDDDESSDDDRLDSGEDAEPVDRAEMEDAIDAMDAYMEGDGDNDDDDDDDDDIDDDDAAALKGGSDGISEDGEEGAESSEDDEEGFDALASGTGGGDAEEARLDALLDAHAKRMGVSAAKPKPSAKQQPTPKRSTPKQPTPKQPTPKQPTPKQPTPKQPTPKQPTPTPKQQTPKQQTPKQPKQPTPQQPTPQQPTPKPSSAKQRGRPEIAEPQPRQRTGRTPSPRKTRSRAKAAVEPATKRSKGSA